MKRSPHRTAAVASLFRSAAGSRRVARVRLETPALSPRRRPRPRRASLPGPARGPRGGGATWHASRRRSDFFAPPRARFGQG